jgi:hypothetical protein
MNTPLVVLVGHDKLQAAEIQDLTKELGTARFETISINPATAGDHEREIDRLRPARVILPREPLRLRAEALPYVISARSRTLAPHLRFVYERWGRRLRTLEEERRIAA